MDQESRPRWPATEKPSPRFLGEELQKLATGFTAKITAEVLEFHMDLYQNYPKSILVRAFDRVKREWPEASKFPPPRFILDRVNAVLTEPPPIEQLDIRKVDPEKSKHPDFRNLANEDRRREFQKMVLESKASGAWEPQKEGMLPNYDHPNYGKIQQQAICDLERFNRGEEVQAPWRLQELIQGHYRTDRIRIPTVEGSMNGGREPGSDDE